MGIKKVICKKFEYLIYKKYGLNSDLLDYILSYINNLYLNNKEKELYLIVKMNKKLKQKIYYFGCLNNEYINYCCRHLDLSINYIFINYLFDRVSCDLKITNKYNFKWDNITGKYIGKIEPNVYEINIKTAFTFQELNGDNLKALRSVLFRLRYIDKNGLVYYNTYSLKKSNYRQVYNLNIIFIVKIKDNNINNILKNTFKENVPNNRIYDINNFDPAGENNKHVKKNITFVKQNIIDKIINTLDCNINKLIFANNKKMTNYI